MPLYHYYTPEEDARIRAAYELHGAERLSALGDLADECGRNVTSLQTRYRLLRSWGDEGPISGLKRQRRAFTPAEDAILLGMIAPVKAKLWNKLSDRLGRPVSTLKHRRIVLKRSERQAEQVQQVQRSIRIPVATPVWFDRKITRERLMAGR